MLGNPFGCKVNVNPLTTSSYNKDDNFSVGDVPIDDNFLLLDGDNFLLLEGVQFDLLGP